MTIAYFGMASADPISDLPAGWDSPSWVGSPSPRAANAPQLAADDEDEDASPADSPADDDEDAPVWGDPKPILPEPAEEDEFNEEDFDDDFDDDFDQEFDDFEDDFEKELNSDQGEPADSPDDDIELDDE